MQLGRIFGVTTDYLLKDEIELEEFSGESDSDKVRVVTLAEANEYLEQRKSSSVKIAVGTFLCILSVIPLLFLGVLYEEKADFLPLSENFAMALGLILMFFIVAGAVCLFWFAVLKTLLLSFWRRSPLRRSTA